MAPDPGTADQGKRTVACNFDTLVPDEKHKVTIRDAVHRTHKATLLATELLNLHVRRCLEERNGVGLDQVLSPNWLLNAYNEVTTGRVATKVEPELRDTRDRFMPRFEAVDRRGLTQIFAYECRNLATVAANNVWMHFQRRVLSHVRLSFELDPETYAALSKDEKRTRQLHLLQIAEDVCRPPSLPHRSPAQYHSWIVCERSRLGIDAAVGEWKDKPLLYHLKCHPERFLASMRIMSAEREAAGGAAFSLLPLRRTLVPRHIRFDQKALRDLLCLGRSEFAKQQASKRRRTTEAGGAVACATMDDGIRAQKRERRDKAAMVDEKAQVFGEVLDLRAAKIRQRDRFDFAFTTDGVSARLQCSSVNRGRKGAPLTSLPSRGIHAIDELKRVSRLEELHVVGIDPGIREIIVAVDQDDPKNSSPVRYTQRQRLRDLRSRQYADEGRRAKPYEVTAAEHDLANHNSRSASLNTFCAYCRKRHEAIEECLAFYGEVDHRRRRWKTYIKTQQSEERLYERLRAIHKKEDVRRLVLAYGAWGATDGASCVKRGNPPTIGVGLMRKLSKRFVLALTPEHGTSKTCCKCLGPCGPWEKVEEERGGKIRGLRICQDEGCKLPMNRDRLGASNIGFNFCRLFRGEAPMRTMTDEEREFHRLQIGRCMACDAE